LSACSPRSLKDAASFPAIASRTAAETTMPPGCAMPSSRAAMLIADPNRSPALVDHIAKMDTNAKLEVFALLACELPLEGHSTTDCLHRASELRQDAITSSVGNPALVQFDLLLGCVSDFSKSSESCRLVRLHEL